MSQYQVIVPERVQKTISKLSKPEQNRLGAIFEYLKNDPYPPKSIKLVNRPGYRIRFGDYRLLYKVEDQQLTILVLKVAHRKDAYRG